MPITHVALAFLIILVWGLNFIAIRLSLDGIPPIFLVCLRFFLVSFPAVFFFKRPAVPFRKIALFGLVMFALQFSLFFVGMNEGVSPGLAALLMQVHIFFSILFAVIFFGERLHIGQLVGGGMALAGIWLVGRHLEGEITCNGLMMIIAAAASWGAGNIMSKKLGKVNTLSLVVWASLVAWPPVLCLSLYVEGGEAILHSLENLTGLVTACVFYIAYLATFFCFGTWSWLLHHHKVSSIAPFTLLVPVVALFSSALILGETIFIWKIQVALLVLGGLSINLIGERIR